MKTIHYKKGITHGGVFHADDVFCTALLKYLNPDIIIERKFKITDEDINDDTIIFDIGFGKFDHHQPDAEVRENGIKYASFGLLWREFMSDESFFESVDQTLVLAIDTQDNGGERNELSDAIKNMNAGFDEDSSDPTFFENAVDVALKILTRRLKKESSMETANKETTAALEEARANNNKYVVLNRYVPFGNIIVGTEIKAVISPSLRGGYQLQIPTISLEDRTLVFTSPEEWISGKARPEGMSFIHPSGFIMSFDTLEHAIACAKYITT